jgi:hypothetical protein
MSGSKRILVIASLIISFTSIAYFTMEIPAGKNATVSSSNYASEYLLGFSTPLVGAGMIFLMGTHLVLRTKKRVVKKTIRQTPAA